MQGIYGSTAATFEIVIPNKAFTSKYGQSSHLPDYQYRFYASNFHGLLYGRLDSFSQVASRIIQDVEEAVGCELGEK